MLAVDNRIKEAYNQYTTQRKSKIVVGTNEYFIQNMDLYADAYDEGNIIGNAIARTLTFDIETEYVRGLDEFRLYDGIWTGEDYEYIDLGTFKLFEEQGTDNFFSSITAYDNLIKFNVPYSPDSTEYPTTLYGLLQNICEQAGVELGTQSIANGNRELPRNIFVEGETLKDILKAICGVSGTFAMISEDKVVLKLKGTDRLTLTNYQIEKPEYKRTTWKWNQVVLGMQFVEGEYVQKRDEEDIEENGVHKIVINDNPFTFTQELREAYIDELFDQLNGFTYVAFETNWEGLPYVELGDLLTINGKDTMVLRYEIKSPDGLNSFLQAPSVIDSVVDYIDNTNDIENKQKRTEFIVRKDEQIIEGIIVEQNATNERLSQTIQDVQSIQNLFQITGGNNLIKDSQKLLDDEGLWEYGDPSSYSLFPGNGVHPMSTLQPIEYYYDEPVYVGGYDATLIGKTVSIAKLGISNGKMSTSATNITGLMIDNMYTLSFKITNETNTNAKIKLVGNGNIVYQESFDDTSKMEEVVFSFVANTSNYTLEIQSTSTTEGFTYIYDLMLNKGDVQTWEPSAGEIVSTTLKLSQLGFQVYSTGSEIATLMTSQGFDIRRFQNGTLYEIVTSFDKDGFKSKKGTLEQLEIGNFEYKTITYQGYETLVLYKKEGDS